VDVIVEVVGGVEGHVTDVTLVAADINVGDSFVGSHAIVGLVNPEKIQL
jgi:hypothetical protein